MTIKTKNCGLIYFVFVALTFNNAFAANTTLNSNIVQSPNDDRQYKSVTLPNKLEVLLISDVNTDKAAAALDVKVGSGSDPEDYEGLAHFLEHMLFLGTEKYPKAGSYQAFINKQGGSHNAYTSFDNTNYFFDVNANALEPALDRFSQQFIAPTFTAKYVEREKNAVHSEYSAKLKDDSRLYFSAFKATINPENPYHNFSVGNLTTLSDRNGKTTRDVLIEFYTKHYSANQMKLVVLGRESIPQLEKWVTNKFSKVPNNNAITPEFKAPLFIKGTLPSLLKMEPAMDKRSLSLVFPIPSTKSYYRDKPFHYLANLIGHEGKGSLFSSLKGEGLVESLSAGTGIDTGTEATFNLSYRLTKKGLKNWEAVIERTFSYLNLVKEKGINPLYFNEQKKMLELAFEFKEKSEAIHYVSSLSSVLQEVDTKDALQANYLMESFEPETYKALLQFLNPNNVQISLMAKGLKTELKTKRYEAPYSYSKISDTLIETLSKPTISKELYLPEPNDFIPEDIAMLNQATMKSPENLHQSEGFSLWHLYDTSFGTPKSTLSINLRSPIANDSPKHAILTSIFTSMIQDELNEFTYPAYLAGLNYDLYSHIRGISIKVGGYSEKQNILLAKILKTTKTLSLKQERFDIYKEQMTRALENSAKSKPYNQTISEVRKLILRPQWTEKEKLSIIADISMSDLNTFRQKLLTELDIVILSAGNISRASSLNLANIIQSWMLSGNTKTTKVKRGEVANLPLDKSYSQSLDIDHPDTGYTLYLQGADKSYQEQAKFLLFSQVVSSPYYEKIRTENQLGYIVFATNFSLFEVPGVAFIVQSHVAGVRQLETETQEFLNDYEQTLKDMPVKEFNQHKEALLSKLFEKENTLSAKSGRYWREIDRENYAFNTREMLADEINKLTTEKFLTFYHALTHAKGQKLLTFSQGKNSADESSTEADDPLKAYNTLEEGKLWPLTTPFN